MIYELRQYTLHPGERHVLVDVFEREFLEGQEDVGINVDGQFLDADDPDRFVWVRSFPDMASRHDALTEFYGGPVWKEHRDVANATMIDCDDVLLLRPTTGESAFPAPLRRPPIGTSEAPASAVTVSLCFLAEPVPEAFLTVFDTDVAPALAEAGAPVLAQLRTEYAENTFTALPVRTGEHVFAWFSRFADARQVHPHDPADLVPWLTRPVQHLTLRPTPRSLLR